MSKFRRLVVDLTDFLDRLHPCEAPSRAVREDQTAQALLGLFQCGVLNWRRL